MDEQVNKNKGASRQREAYLHNIWKFRCRRIMSRGRGQSRRRRLEKRSENKKDPRHTEAATGGESPEFPGDFANSSLWRAVIVSFRVTSYALFIHKLRDIFRRNADTLRKTHELSIRYGNELSWTGRPPGQTDRSVDPQSLVKRPRDEKLLSAGL